MTTNITLNLTEANDLVLRERRTRHRSTCGISNSRLRGALMQRALRKRRRAYNRRLIRRLKQAGCWLCSARPPEESHLHFHHVGKKKGCIASLVICSTTALLEEIARTRLICRECHQEHHELLKSDAWQGGDFYDV